MGLRKGSEVVIWPSGGYIGSGEVLGVWEGTGSVWRWELYMGLRECLYGAGEGVKWSIRPWGRC